MLSARSRTLIDLATTVVIVATCGVLVWANRGRIWPPSPTVPPPDAPISIEGAPTKGDPVAPVVIVMYTDYQCPYCARFERETLPILVRDYIDTGKVRLVVRHHPLEAIHPLAFEAALAATCAGHQGRFWEVHERLFERQKALDAESFTAIALEAGLDIATFRGCTANPETAALVRADSEKRTRGGS
jgi:protein-disulfide isomerase